MPGQVSTKTCPSPLHVGERDIPVTDFHVSKRTKDGRQSWCKKCRAERVRRNPEPELARMRKWYAEHGLAYQRMRYQDEDYRQKVKEWNRAWRERTGYKRPYRKRSAEKTRETARRYRAKDPEGFKEKQRVYNSSYRTRKTLAGGNASEEKLRQRWDYYGGKCWMCGDPAKEMDHVKPVSKGGGSWASNLRPACTPCNRKKRDKWPFSPI